MKTSRAMTSSLIILSISGATGWPLASIWAFRALTRAMGTALPLTMATFWAEADRAAAPRTAAATMRASCFCFMLIRVVIEKSE
jgi:hypothetical protein